MNHCESRHESLCRILLKHVSMPPGDASIVLLLVAVFEQNLVVDLSLLMAVFGELSLLAIALYESLMRFD